MSHREYAEDTSTGLRTYRAWLDAVAARYTASVQMLSWEGPAAHRQRDKVLSAP